MSNRERVLQLINDISDEKLIFIVNVLESMLSYADESIEPDEWDKEMLERAEHENDGVSISLEELAEDLNIEI